MRASYGQHGHQHTQDPFDHRTAPAAGGPARRFLGSSQQVVKGYSYWLDAVVGYFALSSQRVTRHRAWLSAGLFFLLALTAAIGNFAYAAGPGFYFLFQLFPPGFVAGQSAAAP